MKDLIHLLTQKQKRQLFYLSILLIVGMGLEVFGLSALIPVLSSLLDPNFIETIPFLNTHFSHLSNQEILMAGLLFITIVYFFKSAYLLFLFYRQNKFIYTSTSNLANRLFYNYVGQNFIFHLNKNKADITKNVQVEIENFRIYMMALITFVVESFLALSILATLIYVEPQGATIIGLFFALLGGLYFQFSKKKVKSWGILREEKDKHLSKTIIETIEGIKIIKLMEIEDFFIKRFFKLNNKKANILTGYTTVSEASRYLLEVIAVVGLILYVLFLLHIGRDTTVILSRLGLFVAATFRLIPSVNRILSSIQKIKYFTSTLKVLKIEFDQFIPLVTDQTSNSTVVFKEKIDFKNLSFWYGNNSTKILDAVNFTIKKGQYIGLIGPSGSGKSTLINILIGLIFPKSGSIEIDGEKLDHFNSFNWHSLIGYVPQETFIIDDSIEKNIALGVEAHELDKKRLFNVIQQAQLSDYVADLPNGIDTVLGDSGSKLSGGQKQRIGIARALYSSSEIICFDEATSALDEATEKEFLEFINSIRKEKTIITVSHKKKTLEHCDIIYKISNKKIKKV